MRRVMVRYRVKPDRVTENEELVRGVYTELAAVAAPAFHYATFLLDDGVTFVHIAVGDGPFSRLAAFRAFQQGLHERCDEPPVFAELGVVGSYRAFA